MVITLAEIEAARKALVGQVLRRKVKGRPVEGVDGGQVVIVNRLSRLWQSLGLAILAIVLASLAGWVVSVRLAQRIAAGLHADVVETVVGEQGVTFADRMAGHAAHGPEEVEAALAQRQSMSGLEEKASRKRDQA